MAAKKNKNDGLVNNVKHYFNVATYAEIVALSNACARELGKHDYAFRLENAQREADRIKKHMKKTSWKSIDRGNFPFRADVGVVFTPPRKRKFFCGGIYTYNKRFYALSQSGALYVFVELAREWVRKDVPRLGCNFHLERVIL